MTTMHGKSLSNNTATGQLTTRPSPPFYLHHLDVGLTVLKLQTDHVNSLSGNLPGTPLVRSPGIYSYWVPSPTISPISQHSHPDGNTWNSMSFFKPEPDKLSGF